MKRNFVRLFPLLLFLMAPSPARAVIYTWSGLGNDDGWNTGANWAGGTRPPSTSAETALIFTGNQRLNPMANIPGDFILNALTFDNNAGAFVLSGNALDFRANASSVAPAITQSSANNIKINNNLLLNNGDLALGGNGAGTLTLGGMLSGSAGLNKTGSGLAILTGSNTYSGTTSITAGTLQLNPGGSLSSDLVLVSRGSILNIDGGSLSNSAERSFVLGFSGSQLTATTNLSSGFMSAGEEDVGYQGQGIFNQSGGTNNVGYGLYLATSTMKGTYNLSGVTSVLSAAEIHVGENGVGIFNQSGGSSTTNGGFLYLGFQTNGQGTYNLSGGTLTTGETHVGGFSTLAATFNQTGGTHATDVLSLSGDTASIGVYNLDGGTLKAGSVTSGYEGTRGSSTFNFNGGKLQASGNSTGFFQDLTAANVRNGGASIDTNGFNVTVAQNLAHSKISGDNTVDGGLTKLGLGTLTLTGTNTFTGPLIIGAGTLSISSESNLGAINSTLNIGGGGQLLFTNSLTLSRTYNLGASILAASSGATVTFTNGATVNGGFLGAGGTEAFTAGSALNGATTTPGSVVTTSGAVSFAQDTLRGTLTVGVGSNLTATNTFLSSAGTLTINGTVNTSGFESNGVMNLNSGSTLSNTTSALILGGGSRTTISSGGALSTVNGVTIELNGGLLINNGTQSGVLNVNYGSTAKGAGTFGTVNVNDGGRFAPGNSPGIATVGNLSLGSAGRFEFELNSAHATAGHGADFINVLGSLALTATTEAQITIAIISLNEANQPTALADFDPFHGYTFTLATAAGGISGFASEEFAVDSTGFANSLQGGRFEIRQNGNNLELQFRPVPEPSTASFFLIALACVSFLWINPKRLSR